MGSCVGQGAPCLLATASPGCRTCRLGGRLRPPRSARLGGEYGSRKPLRMKRHLKNYFPRQQGNKNNCVNPSAWVGSAQERWTSTPKHLFRSLRMRGKEPSPPCECKSQGKLNSEIVITCVCDFAQLRLNKAGLHPGIFPSISKKSKTQNECASGEEEVMI